MSVGLVRPDRIHLHVLANGEVRLKKFRTEAEETVSI